MEKKFINSKDETRKFHGAYIMHMHAFHTTRIGVKSKLKYRHALSKTSMCIYENGFTFWGVYSQHRLPGFASKLNWNTPVSQFHYTMDSRIWNSLNYTVRRGVYLGTLSACCCMHICKQTNETLLCSESNHNILICSLFIQHSSVCY